MKNDENDVLFCTEHCTASEFQCATGRNYCIPLEKQCNGIGDCRDHSDEKNCNCECFLFNHSQISNRSLMIYSYHS